MILHVTNSNNTSFFNNLTWIWVLTHRFCVSNDGCRSLMFSELWHLDAFARHLCLHFPWGNVLTLNDLKGSCKIKGDRRNRTTMDNKQPFTNPKLLDTIGLKRNSFCQTLPSERFCFTNESVIKNMLSLANSLKTNHSKENEVKDIL